MDPKIISNTCNNEGNGTVTCIQGNPHYLDNMAANFSLTAGGVENHHCVALGGKFPSKFDTVIPKKPLYEGMVVWILNNPKIINNTWNTEENGTVTCIQGNPHDLDNMAANFSLTAWGVENHHFLALGGQFFQFRYSNS